MFAGVFKMCAGLRMFTFSLWILDQDFGACLCSENGKMDVFKFKT